MLKILSVFLFIIAVPFSSSAGPIEEGCPADPVNGQRLDGGIEVSTHVGGSSGGYIKGPFGPDFRTRMSNKPSPLARAALADFYDFKVWGTNCIYLDRYSRWANEWAKVYRKRLEDSFQAKNFNETWELRQRIHQACDYIHDASEELSKLNKGRWKYEALLDRMESTVSEVERICDESGQRLDDLESELQQKREEEQRNHTLAVAKRNARIVNSAKTQAKELKASYEGMPEVTSPGWMDTAKSYFGYSKIDQAFVRRIQTNHHQVMSNAQFVRETFNLENVSSHLSAEAREYLLSEIEISEQMANIALRSAQLGGDREWVDLLAQYSEQSSQAIADFGRGLAKGLSSGFYDAYEVMHHVFKNPELINAIPTAIMKAIKDPIPVLSHIKDSFMQFNVKVLTGSAEEKGEAIGGLMSDLLIIVATKGAGESLVGAGRLAMEHLARNAAQRGLVEAAGTQLLTEIKTVEKLGTALAESEVTAQKVVESAKRLGVAEMDIARFTNKANHVFGVKSLERHNLADFLQRFNGNSLEAFKSLEDAAQKMVNEGLIREVFETGVTVRGAVVTVRGRVADGVAKINTAFIPKN